MIKFERCPHPALSCPDERERDRFLDQLIEALNTAFRLPLADESPQTANDVAGAGWAPYSMVLLHRRKA
jgi:hypothetical protein